jgi:hypothetical protein
MRNAITAGPAAHSGGIRPFISSSQRFFYSSRDPIVSEPMANVWIRDPDIETGFETVVTAEYLPADIS